MPTNNVIPLVTCVDCIDDDPEAEAVEADTVGKHNLCDRHFRRRAAARALSRAAMEAIRSGLDEDDILGAAYMGIELESAGFELPADVGAGPDAA